MTDARVVLTTIDDLERAKQLARELVESRLAACVNLVDRVRSIYRWQGKVETAAEVLLVIKTSEERLPALKEILMRLHPYEIPEFLVLGVVEGSDPYLVWLFAASRMTPNCPESRACYPSRSLFSSIWLNPPFQIGTLLL